MTVPSVIYWDTLMRTVGHAMKFGGSSGDGNEYEIALQPTSVLDSYPQRLDRLSVSLPRV